MTEKIGISLGWQCASAVKGVREGTRKRKQDGYKTCPFDEMLSNYPGIIDCFKDNFKYFCDPTYLTLISTPLDSLWHGDQYIYHTKYRFIFNHESPNIDNLHKREDWKFGPTHFLKNNYTHFIIRYRQRIKHLISYLHSGIPILFILERYHPNDGAIELETILKKQYPQLQFEFQIWNETHVSSYRKFYLELIKLPKDHPDVQRLNYP
jgi:hypothetical protein